jgi:TPR repeat protein
MAKDLSKAAINTSNKAQKTSKDRFDKADILLAKKEISAASKSTTDKTKLKIVQDSVVLCDLNLLQSEEKLIDEIKLRAAVQGITLNKSEILRTGIVAIERQTDKQLKTTFSNVERIKESDDLSISLDSKKLEQYSASQQVHLDTANNEYILNIKDAHEKQSVAQESHITELRGYIDYFKQQIEKQAVSQESHIKELSGYVDYYKQQVEKQQQTIDNLNLRYETAVTFSLKEEKKDSPINVLSLDAELDANKNNARRGEIITSPQSSIITTTDIEITNPLSLTEHEHLFTQAVAMREEGENAQAFLLFEQAANLGDSRAMGAMGRSFFLGEGIEEDELKGLAWLINAAELYLPPAMTRVKDFQKNDPDLYQEALTLSAKLFKT